MNYSKTFLMCSTENDQNYHYKINLSTKQNNNKTKDNKETEKRTRKRDEKKSNRIITRGFTDNQINSSSACLIVK